MRKKCLATYPNDVGVQEQVLIECGFPASQFLPNGLWSLQNHLTQIALVNGGLIPPRMPEHAT
jgi:hypothetical protein